MSNTKTVMGQASNQYVVPTDITDVFSTYLYEGNNTNPRTITNGIDLAGEGGMVWIKQRTATNWHVLSDTERGTNSRLSSNETSAAGSGVVTAFNSNGFNVNDSGQVNFSGDYVSWTFRKAPKFFDVVTYTGDGVAGRTISHNLGSAPGMVVIKRTDTGNDPYNSWRVAHIEGNTLTALDLDTTSDASSTPWLLWSDSSTATSAYAASGQTDAHFTVGSHASVNGSGGQFVAYIFAHNDGDGGFGPDGSDIIKCGSYTGNGSNAGPEIDLGFEPQWLMVKKTNGVGGWVLIDTMRGFTNNAPTDDPWLRADGPGAESFDYLATPLASGFQITRSSNIVNTSGGNYIYMAIRRGPLAPPTAATEVFAIDVGDSTDGFISNFEVDMALHKRVSYIDYNKIASRLTQGKYLITSETSSETSNSNYTFDSNIGWGTSMGTLSNEYSWMWKRAPGYFDVVAYTGTNIAGLTINHNLGVVPEMIWVKNRSASEYWAVYHKDLNGGTNPSHYFLRLNTTDVETDYNEIWNDTEPTATQFTVGQQGVVNGSGTNHIAYLFASLPGISKVGSYSGNGSSQNIDCGFTSGARFVLIKKTNSAANWILFDSARGIVSGNDPYLFLNTTSAEGTGYDLLDPYASGFTIASGDATINASGDSYIFYAIA
jgi:hypothetical protein